MGQYSGLEVYHKAKLARPKQSKQGQGLASLININITSSGYRFVLVEITSIQQTKEDHWSTKQQALWTDDDVKERSFSQLQRIQRFWRIYVWENTHFKRIL